MNTLILIITLVFGTYSHTFNPNKLNKEFKEIDKEFLKTQGPNSGQSPIKTEPKATSKYLLNLESEYFDRVRTKKSGIKKRRTRGR